MGKPHRQDGGWRSSNWRCSISSYLLKRNLGWRALKTLRFPIRRGTHGLRSCWGRNGRCQGPTAKGLPWGSTPPVSTSIFSKIHNAMQAKSDLESGRWRKNSPQNHLVIKKSPRAWIGRCAARSLRLPNLTKTPRNCARVRPRSPP